MLKRLAVNELNDGRGTWIDVRTGNEWALDVTLVSVGLAGVSRWEVLNGWTVGSDHYPVLCSVGGRVDVVSGEGIERWLFGKADWGVFQVVREELVAQLDMVGGVDEVNGRITSDIIEAETETILRSRGRGGRKMVLWWTEECSQVGTYMQD